MGQRPEGKYVEWGRQAIVELLQTQHAVLWQEAQAKIADVKWPSLLLPIQPHHLTTARRELLDAEVIVESMGLARGGTNVPVLHLRDLQRRQTVVARTAARKRLLAARMLRWTTATSKHPQGMVGGAGERVVERSIEKAAPYGLRYAGNGPGEVNFLLGDVVEGGPLDGAVWADVSDDDGRVADSVLCPIEVKNIRHWVYPNADELYQVLYKAAKLQERLPDVLICPVLITRRKSWSANQMSRDLGFRVLDVNQQFLLPAAEVREDHFIELRDELGYLDLVRTEDAHPSVVRPLSGTLIQTAVQNAERWRLRGSKLGDFYRDLREDMDPEDRTELLNELRDAARELDDPQEGW
jgi:hypothetical protein